MVCHCMNGSGFHRGGRTVANNVLKFLRWRKSDENGDVAQGFIGVVFDVTAQGDSPVEYAEWVPGER